MTKHEKQEFYGLDYRWQPLNNPIQDAYDQQGYGPPLGEELAEDYYWAQRGIVIDRTEPSSPDQSSAEETYTMYARVGLVKR